jgi:hypothetical protein
MNNKQIPARVSHGRNAFLEAPVKNDNGSERSILPAGQKPLYLCPHAPAGLDHSIIYLCPHFPAGLDRSILPAGQTPLYLCRHFTAASERNIIYMCLCVTAGMRHLKRLQKLMRREICRSGRPQQTRLPRLGVPVQISPEA